MLLITLFFLQINDSHPYEPCEINNEAKEKTWI